MPKYLLVIFLLLLSFISCQGNVDDSESKIKEDFTKAMNAYQDIWETKDKEKAKSLAEQAFTNEEIIEQVLASYYTNLEKDQGVKITQRKYTISISEFNNEKASLQVKANLKGYPISLNSGEKKVESIQDFSFGPHNFIMEKEQGVWKISQF